MVALPPPRSEASASPPSARRRTGAWRLVAASALTVLLIVATLTGFWFVTGTGPFATVEPSRWALDMTQVPELHARSLTGAGVIVCIVDSGVDATHPELQGVSLVAWKDFVDGRTTPYDDEGHGTAMAGIIFARGRIPGVAPGASLISVKAIAAGGVGTDLNIARSVSFCVDPNRDGDLGDGADVISLSLGGDSQPYLGTATENAVNEAMDRGVIVVAAAGNDGQSDDGDVESPASVPRVIAVGAVNIQGTIAPWSSRGNNGGGFPPIHTADPNRKPELVAPGVSIATILPKGGYAYVSGTSPAAALVAGIVALLLDEHPVYRHDASRLAAFKESLMRGACGCVGTDVPHHDRSGYGVVRARDTDVLMP